MVTCFQGGNSILRSLKWYKSLDSNSIRAQEGFFLVEGMRAVQQIITNTPLLVDEILVADTYKGDVMGTPERVRKITLSQMNAFSSHKNSQGIVAVVKIPQDSYSDNVPSEPGDKILLLEHIQDPGNVGTLLRTAAAFDFSGVVLSSMSADPFSSKTVQASAGSLLSLWIRRTPNYIKTVEQLQKMGFKIAAMSISGSEETINKKDKIIIALGNEGNGLSQDILSMADSHCRISINDRKVESLNVAITGALVMYIVRSGK